MKFKCNLSSLSISFDKTPLRHSKPSTLIFLIFIKKSIRYLPLSIGRDCTYLISLMEVVITVDGGKSLVKFKINFCLCDISPRSTGSSCTLTTCPSKTRHTNSHNELSGPRVVISFWYRSNRLCTGTCSNESANTRNTEETAESISAE